MTMQKMGSSKPEQQKISHILLSYKSNGPSWCRCNICQDQNKSFI